MAADFGAGIAASTTDPNVAYFNPAAMKDFKGQVGGFSTVFRSTSARFKGNVQVSSIAGSNFSTNSQGGRLTATPTFTYVAPISKRWVFGLSVVSPLNSHMHFSKAQATRYVVTENQLSTVDIDPVLSFQILPKLSVGAGLDFIHGYFIYENVNTDTSITNDSDNTNKLAGWAQGWNTGVFWQATSTTKLGASYHSRAMLHMTGTSKFLGNGTLASNRTRTKMRINIPAMTVISAQQVLNKQWLLLATAAFTQWKQLNHTYLRNTATPTGKTNTYLTQKLKNTWKFILGTHYRLNTKILLMGALGYTPASVSRSRRTITLPDGYQYSASLGLTYTFNDKINIIAGYTHLFNQRTRINATQAFSSDTATSSGLMYSNADILGLQLNWKMT